MSRKKIIDIASAEIGTKEAPPGTNRTKYGQWYGFDGYPWCAQFVSWVYKEAGFPLGRIDDNNGYRDCKSAYNHWRATGEFTTTPEKGDIVLYDWNNDGKCDHTGIFVEWLDATKTKFSAIEGNTAKGNDSDGGMVMLRNDRRVTSAKVFIKPKVLSGVQAPKVHQEDILKRGQKSSTIAQIQKQLYDLGYSITVDGDFGPATERVVKKFQKDNSLDVTGTITPALRGLIESAVDAPKISPKKLTTGTFIKKGDSGAAVVALQKALNKHSANPKLVPDGVFGSVTFRAVKAFQKQKNFVVDGVAGPGTLAGLGVR